jgi:intergrase/recombinase
MRNKNIVSSKYLRKYNFTLMIDCEISFEITNFIQGRASKNVGFNHYLAKRNLAVK